ncbi:MAG: tetratricopeptide repeat protein [Terrimicrobiaceae bacterium]|nr:tetratricopeptide repeat protein [Terrimicrobiaceae bacterium]
MSDDLHDAELSAAIARVEHNPTDLQYRFLLGECLFRRGRHAEAIPELQRVQMNPKTRAAAMKRLAESFTILGDQKKAEDILRQLDSERFDDEDDSGSAPSPSPLKPIDPTTSPAMNSFPEDETKNG